MNDSDVIISILSWTSVFVFMATSLITILALINKVKLPNDSYLKKLFFLLIVEVVAVGVFAFKKKLMNHQAF